MMRRFPIIGTMVLILAVMFARAQTESGENAELQKLRRELEAERAALRMERAQFEANKARWGSQRGAQPAQSNTNIPLYVSRQAARLYRSGQIAGDLPAVSVVPGRANPRYRGWLVIRVNNQIYDAEERFFVESSAALEEAKARVDGVRRQYEELKDRFEELRMRRGVVSQLITVLESSKPQTTVMIPMPLAKGDERERSAPMLVFNNDPYGMQSARLRSDLRGADKELEKLQTQLRPLVEALNRVEASFGVLRDRIETARSSLVVR